MITTDADGAPFRNILAPEFNSITDDFHRWFGRAHKGLLGDVLLEQVVLDRAADLIERNALYSAAAQYMAQRTEAGGLMVIDVVT